MKLFDSFCVYDVFNAFHVYFKFYATDVCDAYVATNTFYVFGVLDEFGDALDAGNTSYCISKRILFDLSDYATTVANGYWDIADMLRRYSSERTEMSTWCWYCAEIGLRYVWIAMR